jgi:phosphate transport system substrate-binding protein
LIAQRKIGIDRFALLANDHFMKKLTITKTCKLSAFLALIIPLVGCGNGKIAVQEQIRIVGSSSAREYSEIVSEALLIDQPKLKPPIIEATGTGKGIELFCSAIGGTTPDIAFASRRMKKAEHDACEANGVKDTIEFQIGMDGVVLAQAKGGPAWQLTGMDLYRAFAAFPFGYSNRAEKWNEVNPALPALPVQLYGPGSTSGTRTGFADLIMAPACKSDPRIAAIKDEATIKKTCTQIRDDGHYVLTDETDELMLYKLKTNKNAIGIVPYAFVTKHNDVIQPLRIEGVMPSEANILDESYAGSRRVYVYVKRAHLDDVPGLKDYVARLQSESAPDQALPKAGLIPVTDAARTESAEIVKAMRTMDVRGLK